MLRRSLTLIELLMVIAILAILAAIAVPNYLRADLRSRVSQVAGDMRSIAHALEAYKVDQLQYPMDFQFYQWGGGGGLANPFAFRCLARLSTPVAYLNALPTDAFEYKKGWYDGDRRQLGYKADLMFRQLVLPSFRTVPYADLTKHWVVMSPGPDETSNFGEYAMFGEQVWNSIPAGLGGGPGCRYDPGNGTVSAGDITRVGP